MEQYYKNSDNEKYEYSRYGITFADLWNFENEFARNGIISSVDNSLSSHSDNCKNNFVTGEGLTFGVNGKFDSPDKKISINFTKANTKFSLSFNYNTDNSYLFVNGKEIFKFEADIKNVNLFKKCI